nr:AzlD domain-containing protein [Pectobacterium sp. PL152]
MVIDIRSGRDRVFNRYIFLEPAVPVKIPVLLHRALKYSAPCLLTAICGPIILMDHGVIRAFPDNPYFLGAIVSVVISFYQKYCGRGALEYAGFLSDCRVVVISPFF